MKPPGLSVSSRPGLAGGELPCVIAASGHLSIPDPAAWAGAEGSLGAGTGLGIGVREGLVGSLGSRNPWKRSGCT